MDKVKVRAKTRIEKQYVVIEEGKTGELNRDDAEWEVGAGRVEYVNKSDEPAAEPAK